MLVKQYLLMRLFFSICLFAYMFALANNIIVAGTRYQVMFLYDRVSLGTSPFIDFNLLDMCQTNEGIAHCNTCIVHTTERDRGGGGGMGGGVNVQ